MAEGLGEIIHERIHDKKWFTARGLESLSKSTGQEVDFIARLIMIIVFILLITSKNWIVCNTIVVIVPLLLTYVYPNEKPPQENMLVYWISAFVLTAFDRMLEVFPLYYVGKLCVLLSLLVEPSCLNERLKEILKITEKSRNKAAVASAKQPEQPAPAQPASTWGRFTESLRAAIGGGGGASTQSSYAPGVPAPQPRRSPDGSRRSSQRSENQTALAIKSKSEQNVPRSVPSSAPTPYDTKPKSDWPKLDTQSTYVNIPKPVTHDGIVSVRADPLVNPSGSQRLKPVEAPPSPSARKRGSVRRSPSK